MVPIFLTIILFLTSSASARVTNRPTVSPTQHTTGSTLTTSSTTLTTSNGTVMTTTYPHISTTSPSQDGCLDPLSFSPGNFFPSSVTTCYDDKGLMVPLSGQDTLLSAGTTCIFMSSGHLMEAWSWSCPVMATHGWSAS
eukprot:TRINITY_DN1432_c0_g1_i1.p1 TRINITY_DN1432_c0_g1~~TRINITY_DN1432_c0_g1_i1.p1  ORF type:complete len:155 (-),score=50.58 TRINITY_DN1432_c0_g1_i1:6-422(-)